MPRLAAEEQIVAIRTGIAANSVTQEADEVTRALSDLDALATGHAPSRRRGSVKASPEALAAMGIAVILPDDAPLAAEEA